MSKIVTLLDYGMCNMLNVARAFEYSGFEVRVCDDVKAARTAGRLVVPGVGAFAKSMEELKKRGFDDTIREFIATGRPFLGICVGMQMLFEGSDEFGTASGLGILGGRVVKVPDKALSGDPQRIPHIGWSRLVLPETKNSWTSSILARFQNRPPSVYFVHSFAALPRDGQIRLADTEYGGHRLCAAVSVGNVHATQFHPERSGGAGLEMLKTFGSL
jgi:imidazole glycerol-phosphate synthase subunit HisH